MVTRTQSELIGENRTALFSECMKYRYALDIIWDPALPAMQVIGLNPSTADEMKDDNTVRRCKGFARAWGYGGLLMTNLFAYRATDPKDMKRAAEPIGGIENDQALIGRASRAGIILAAWGNHGSYLGRDKHVAGLFPSLQCLSITQQGQPEHPLYIESTRKPSLFRCQSR